MTDPSKAKDPAAGPQPIAPGPISKFIAAMVDICVRHAWIVIVIAIIVAATAAHYAATHFAINTNTDDFLSEKLPWRQRLIELDKYFPQRNNEILVVIDGNTPELAESAAAQLSKTSRQGPISSNASSVPTAAPTSIATGFSSSRCLRSPRHRMAYCARNLFSGR